MDGYHTDDKYRQFMDIFPDDTSCRPGRQGLPALLLLASIVISCHTIMVGMFMGNGRGIPVKYIKRASHWVEILLLQPVLSSREAKYVLTGKWK